jgi:hypothetical protein
VGRAIAVAALDMEGANPWTRLPHSEHRSLEGVRSWITSVLRAASETRAAHLPPMSDAAVEAIRAAAAPATSSARSSASGSLAREWCAEGLGGAGKHLLQSRGPLPPLSFSLNIDHNRPGPDCIVP